MSIPDNKYCTKCTKYKANKCNGIWKRSGEFPYNTKIHCFTNQDGQKILRKKSAALRKK